jgi:hypothetical protein
LPEVGRVFFTKGLGVTLAAAAGFEVDAAGFEVTLVAVSTGLGVTLAAATGLGVTLATATGLAVDAAGLAATETGFFDTGLVDATFVEASLS